MISLLLLCAFCASWWLSPDLREYAFEVSPENAFNIRIAVLASKQTFRQIKHALRMIQTLDVDLFAKGVAALVAGAQLLVEIGRHRVVAPKIDVTTDA